MSYPASLTARTVTGRFVTDPDGAPAKGSAIFTLATPMQGPADKTIVPTFSKVVKFVSGEFSITLPATDDPDWTPSRYMVSILIKDQDPIRGYIVVPSAGSGPLDLTELLNLPAPTLGEAYILLSSKGVANGVASLGSDGKLLSSQMPAGSGGSVSWNDVQDKPTTFTPSAHSHAITDVSGLATSLANIGMDITNILGTISTINSNLSSKANASDVTTALSGKANASHTHSQSDITGLTSALSAKVDSTAVTAAIVANGPKILVLSASASVPGGTPSGSLIFRTAS